MFNMRYNVGDGSEISLIQIKDDFLNLFKGNIQSISDMISANQSTSFQIGSGTNDSIATEIINKSTSFCISWGQNNYIVVRIVAGHIYINICTDYRETTNGVEPDGVYYQKVFNLTDLSITVTNNLIIFNDYIFTLVDDLSNPSCNLVYFIMNENNRSGKKLISYNENGLVNMIDLYFISSINYTKNDYTYRFSINNNIYYFPLYIINKDYYEISGIIPLQKIDNIYPQLNNYIIGDNIEDNYYCVSPYLLIRDV